MSSVFLQSDLLLKKSETEALGVVSEFIWNQRMVVLDGSSRWLIRNSASPIICALASSKERYTFNTLPDYPKTVLTAGCPTHMLLDAVGLMLSRLGVEYRVVPGEDWTGKAATGCWWIELIGVDGKDLMIESVTMSGLPKGLVMTFSKNRTA
jgi:hypothetical protein